MDGANVMGPTTPLPPLCPCLLVVLFHPFLVCSVGPFHRAIAPSKFKKYGMHDLAR